VARGKSELPVDVSLEQVGGLGNMAIERKGAGTIIREKTV